LQRRGQKAHLANFSFSDIASLETGIRLSPTLVGVDAGLTDFSTYFPELYLAQWFAEKRTQRVIIWSFHKTGAKPLRENYRVLVERLSIDGIVLIDGGVDGLIRGDESEVGTFVEDAISLFAVNELREIPVRIVVCLGFGIEPDIAHAHGLENMAALMRTGAFLGGCALAPQMDAYQLYEEAVLYAQGKRYQDPSVINSCIISAARGHFARSPPNGKNQRQPVAYFTAHGLVLVLRSAHRDPTQLLPVRASGYRYVSRRPSRRRVGDLLIAEAQDVEHSAVGLYVNEQKELPNMSFRVRSNDLLFAGLARTYLKIMDSMTTLR
jgi:hypothetical protein